MISMNKINEALQKQLDSKQKVEEILSFLESERLSYLNGKLVYISDLYLDDYHFSSSVVTIKNNNNYKSYLNDFVLDGLDLQQAIRFIVDAVNSICLNEDRDVFVERFILHQRMSVIKEKHCLSNNGYYQCLNRAINDCYEYLQSYKNQYQPFLLEASDPYGQYDKSYFPF